MSGFACGWSARGATAVPGVLMMHSFPTSLEELFMSTALILIDVQQSFVHRPYWSAADVPVFLDRINALVRGFEAARLPIVRVLHVDHAPRGNAFSLEAGWVRPLDGLIDFTPALEVQKHRHSALVGSGLSIWLHQQGIRRLVIAGIRTEQCCETTTRHASDEGWEVDYVTEATLTFDMTQPDGQTLPAALIKVRTETVLQDRFATICMVPQALARAAA
jgi:nicotinamidase-related amidase